ncbi:GNAT family N-acetyltransferase [Paramagnetospirillum kuznetsovii]|uniref:GNAT family N-acetyltransferase n=1 Tax=Paramagnetospirillum kuznetsovii TaxID=2053833 RepID=A0A364P1Q4_9PROT|nr:GNAT family N-acetyltransferase [Paramagnetospirillum kuznetsovii]RAU23190.1 GNAT family N-acetyltransferase [Paramagnetospirillum kuznetsovii]
MGLVVRSANPDDMAELVAMLRELAAFERAPPESLRCQEEDFRRDGFGPNPRFECLFAELDGRRVGFVTVLPTYSSWQARPGLVIHDLFVRETARGQGVARALVERVARMAAERKCGRVDVNVLNWNSARAFYEKQGFAAQGDWVLHRLTLAEPRQGETV